MSDAPNTTASEPTRDEDIRPEYKAALARINAALKTLSERAGKTYTFIPTQGAKGDQLILNQFRHVATTLEGLQAAVPTFPPNLASRTVSNRNDGPALGVLPADFAPPNTPDASDITSGKLTGKK